MYTPGQYDIQAEIDRRKLNDFISLIAAQEASKEQAAQVEAQPAEGATRFYKQMQDNGTPLYTNAPSSVRSDVRETPVAVNAAPVNGVTPDTSMLDAMLASAPAEGYRDYSGGGSTNLMKPAATNYEALMQEYLSKGDTKAAAAIAGIIKDTRQAPQSAAERKAGLEYDMLKSALTNPAAEMFGSPRAEDVEAFNQGQEGISRNISDYRDKLLGRKDEKRTNMQRNATAMFPELPEDEALLAYMDQVAKLRAQGASGSLQSLKAQQSGGITTKSGRKAFTGANGKLYYAD